MSKSEQKQTSVNQEAPDLKQVAQKNNSVSQNKVQVRSKTGNSYMRCGIQHNPYWTWRDLTDEQLKVIEGDENLEVR